MIHRLDDEYGSTRHPQMLAQLCGSKRVQIELLPATGHVPHSERPDEVIDLVKTFVQGLA